MGTPTQPRNDDEHHHRKRELRQHRHTDDVGPYEIQSLQHHWAPVALKCGREAANLDHVSNAKTRFQSSFMLMTDQPRVLASSIRGWEKVPTLVSGNPPAGP